MTKIKPFLYIFIVTVLLYLVWNNNADKDNIKAQSSPAIVQSLSINSELEKRVTQLETDLEYELTQRQNFEQRLYELEQSLNKTVSMDQQETTVAKAEPLQNTAINSPVISDDEIKQKLIAVNIPLDTIQSIQQRISNNRLAMLELRDRAIRENWLNTVQYSEKAHELRDPTNGIRKEYGDEVFDAYLYASNQSNRVRVQQVYRGSAAETAGVQVGDIIISYANNRIFTMSDLRQTTVAGESGETVLVELIRDNNPFSTTIPRGPLGISMTVTTLPPE